MSDSLLFGTTLPKEDRGVAPSFNEENIHLRLLLQSQKRAIYPKKLLCYLSMRTLISLTSNWRQSLNSIWKRGKRSAIRKHSNMFAVFASYARNYHVFPNITLEFSLLVRGFYGSAMLQADKCKVAMINVCIGRKIPILSSLYSVYILSWHSIIENPPIIISKWSLLLLSWRYCYIPQHSRHFSWHSDAVLNQCWSIFCIHRSIWSWVPTFIIFGYTKETFLLCRTTSDTYLLYIF